MRKHFVKKYGVAICDYKALTNYVSGNYVIPLSPQHSYRGHFLPKITIFFVSVFCGKNFYKDLLSKSRLLRYNKVLFDTRKVPMDKGVYHSEDKVLYFNFPYGEIFFNYFDINQLKKSGKKKNIYKSDLFIAVLFKIIYWAIASQILRPSFVLSGFGRIRSKLIYIIYIN